MPNSRLTGGPAVFHVDLFADGGAPVNSFVRPGCTDCGILVLIGKGSSEASSRFRSMRLATVRVRALVVLSKEACRCSSERLVISINAERLFAIGIYGRCHGSSEGSRGFDQWGLPRFE